MLHNAYLPVSAQNLSAQLTQLLFSCVPVLYTEGVLFLIYCIYDYFVLHIY